MTKQREQVAEEDRWNVESLFINQNEWEKNFKSFVNLQLSALIV